MSGPRTWQATRRAGRRFLAAGVAAAVLAACSSPSPAHWTDPSQTPGTSSPGTAAAPMSPSPTAASAPWDDPTTAHGGGALAAGSDPAVLPGDLLIADKLNNRLLIIDPQGRVRWQFPRPGDLAPRQTFLIPDDAFFTPDGQEIVVTEEDDFVISVVDIASHRIVYRYGTPGHFGAGPNHVDNPDDAMILPDGYLLSPDIKNCRILLIPPGSHTPQTVFGQRIRPCTHNPPTRFGSPNGAFPMTNGDYLITEINGDWVDAMSLTGKIAWSAHPPNVAYPSDTNEVGPNRYLTADYSTPGQVVIFNQAGHALWRYRPAGAAELRNPSLALPLPNGDVILNDDYNHRVIVVDPRTGKVVWQYGHTGIASAKDGYLNNPDGIDLAPPYSLLVTHAATMGQP